MTSIRLLLACGLLALPISSCFCLDLASLLLGGPFEMPDAGLPTEVPANAVVISDEDLDWVSACAYSTESESDAKMDAAFATFADLGDGTVEVELSDDRCLRFSRTMASGVLQSARFYRFLGITGVVFQDNEALQFAYLRNEAEWSRSEDGVITGHLHDGALLDGDPTVAAPYEVEVVEDWQNRMRQTTRFASNGDVAWRIRIEEGADGTVQTIEHDVDGELVEEVTYVKPESRAQGADCNDAGVTCEDSQTEVLDAALQSAFKRASKCLKGLDRGRDDTWMRYVLLKDRWTRGHTWGCLAAGCGIARWCDTCQDSGDPLNIDIDFDAWSARNASDPANAQGILIHEMLHGVLGYHPDIVVNSSIYDEATRRDKLMRRYTDRVNACEAYCFAPPTASVTMCSCAVCLDTKVCDERCSGLASCREDQGGSPIMSEAIGTACVNYDSTLGTNGEFKATWYNQKSDCTASSCEADGGKCESKSVSCDEGCE